MKTLKFALIAAIVACTMVSLAYADGIQERPKFIKMVNISYDKAVQCQGLLTAMYRQISEKDLVHLQNHSLVATVVYEGTAYRITGTYMQWKSFFTRVGLPSVNKQRAANIN